MQAQQRLGSSAGGRLAALRPEEASCRCRLTSCSAAEQAVSPPAPWTLVGNCNGNGSYTTYL